MKKSKPFSHPYLTTLENFAYKGENDFYLKGHRYNFYSERGDEGYVIFHDDGFRYYFIDNYPGQKKQYRSDVPLRTIEDWRREAISCGIKEEWMKEMKVKK